MTDAELRENKDIFVDIKLSMYEITLIQKSLSIHLEKEENLDLFLKIGDKVNEKIKQMK